MQETDNAIIELSLKLSSIYVMRGMKEEAESGLKYCVETQSQKLVDVEKKWKDEDAKRIVTKTSFEQPADKLEQKEQDTAVLLGMSLGSYGRYLVNERRYNDALPFLERALFYAKHTLGTNSNQYIISLNDFATLHIINKNLDEAERILNDGIRIAEKADLSEASVLYCNLGAVHLRKGIPEEASKTCKIAQNKAQLHNHTLAFKMAEACIKKSASVIEAAKSSS